MMTASIVSLLLAAVLVEAAERALHAGEPHRGAP
jgi:hypothetical protein